MGARIIEGGAQFLELEFGVRVALGYFSLFAIYARSLTRMLDEDNDSFVRSRLPTRGRSVIMPKIGQPTVLSEIHAVEERKLGVPKVGAEGRDIDAISLAVNYQLNQILCGSKFYFLLVLLLLPFRSYHIDRA